MKIFLSYSTKDHQYKDEIKKTLSKLERDGKIKLWVDEKNLRAGELFDEVIEKAICSSDIFLLLLSRDFWASDYIQIHELPLILRLYKEKKALVLPIVLKDSYDLIGYDELKGINGLPRGVVGDKRLKPIDEFKSLSKAYNSILQEIIRQLPEEIEVYHGADYKFVKTFAGHRYQAKNLVDYNLRQLTIPQENLEICSDIRADKFWYDRVFEAINKAEYIVLFLSEGFVGSSFIQRSMLPVVHRQYNLGKCGLSLFLLEDCNFKKDETLNSFQIEPIQKIEKLQFSIDKASNVSHEKIELEFSKLFLIYKVLQKYNKDKHQVVKLGEGSTIEFFEDDVLVEKWGLVANKERIEEYAEVYRDSFDVKSSPYKFGLFQEDTLAGDVAKLQYFFEMLSNLYSTEISKDVSEFFIHQFGSLSPFVQAITDNSAFGIEMFDFNKDINQNSGSIFFFLRFLLEGYTQSHLIRESYNLIEKKFNISISKDNGQIYTQKAFVKTFEKVLTLLKSDRKIDFFEIINAVDLFQSTLELIEDLSFIEQNMELIEQPIVKRSKTNIAQLFVEPTAKLYYAGSNKSENIRHVLDSFYTKLEDRNFLLLLGDFGHGKTTLFKYLTANLSKRHTTDKPIPVFLTLREHFKTNSSLQEAVTNAIMPNSRMTDAFWRDNQWLIFCDGFDELNIFHQENPEWVTLVFSSLLKESQKPNIKIVISSRPILFMERDIHSKTIGRFETLFLNDFNNTQIAQWLENWSQPNQTITLQMLKDRDIVTIARTPVILFLIALMFHDELADSSKKYSKSEIYKTFFDWTVKSGGFIGDDTTDKHIVPTNYREIIQEIAWEIFTHPDSKSGLLHYKILLKELESKLKIDGFDVWDERIFVAHAFKESKKEHIEFLHQSLREYLVAEKLFGVYSNLKVIELNDEDQTEIFTSGYGGFVKKIDIQYEKILLNKQITEAKLDFFIDMTRNLSNKRKTDLQRASYGLAYWNNILEKVHFKNNIILGNLVLLGYLFEINLYNKIDEPNIGQLFMSIQSFFKSDPDLNEFETLLQKSFNKLNFEEVDFNDCKFEKYKIQDVDFNKLKFFNCQFRDVRLIDVSFLDIEFIECFFNNFQYGSFVHIGKCIYLKCQFNQLGYHNRIRDKSVVRYDNCIFSDSDLYYENFEGAIFKNCIFLDTSFSTNEKINSKSIAIEFVDCLVKKDGKVEVLDGQGLDVFVKTGGIE